MITINKNSLIHRFNKTCGIKDEWWWDDQVSLCPYFWGTIGSILKFLFLSGISLAFPSVFGVGALKMFFGDPIFDTYWVYLSPLLGVAIISLICILGIAIIEGVFWCRSKILIFKDNKSTIEKEPNIFYEYLKAKKNKFCPSIQIK